MCRRSWWTNRERVAPDVVLNGVADPRDSIGGQPAFEAIGIEPLDRRVHAQMSGAHQIGHLQIGPAELASDRDDELAMAFPKLRKGLLARRFVLARSASPKQMPLPLYRQVWTAEQGTGGRGLCMRRHRYPILTPELSPPTSAFV